MTYDDRYRYLSKLPKLTLAQMHVRNGGLMGLATYMKWHKDELISILIEDEEADARRGTR